MRGCTIQGRGGFSGLCWRFPNPDAFSKDWQHTPKPLQRICNHIWDPSAPCCIYCGVLGIPWVYIPPRPAKFNKKIAFPNSNGVGRNTIYNLFSELTNWFSELTNLFAELTNFRTSLTSDVLMFSCSHVIMFSCSHVRMFAECVCVFSSSQDISWDVLMFTCSQNHVLRLSKQILTITCSPIGTGTKPRGQSPTRCGQGTAARSNWTYLMRDWGPPSSHDQRGTTTNT